MDISSTGSGMDFTAMKDQMAAMREQMMAKSDTDGSGGLSIDEFSQAAANRPIGEAESAEGKSVEDIFAEIDADGDGELTSAEMEEHMEANRPQMSAQTGAALTMLQESLNSSSTEENSFIDSLLSQLEASDEEDEDDELDAA